MNRCADDGCIVGYSAKFPDGYDFLNIADYLSLQETSPDALYGCGKFSYCPSCGNKVEDILTDYKSKISV